MRLELSPLRLELSPLFQYLKLTLYHDYKNDLNCHLVILIHTNDYFKAAVIAV
jgi:hypothetical protein